MSDECVVYTSMSVPNCSSCKLVKNLLKSRGISYTEFVIGKDLTKMEFQEQFGADVKTVPQVVIGGVRIGGYEELKTYLMT